MKRVIFSAIVMGLVAAAAAWGTSPRYQYQAILDLYPAGKVAEARRAVLAEIEKMAKLVTDGKAANLMRMQERLGFSVTAMLVTQCFRLEAQHGKAAGAPEELFKAADLAVRTIDATIEESRGFPQEGRTTGVGELVTFARSQRTKLLRAWAEALRASGRNDEAAALEKKHDLPPVQPPPPEPQVEKVSGVAIRIVDLLRLYYDALTKEDAKGLDAVLFQGEGFRTGRDIVAAIRLERLTERDFDRIGPVTFDDQTLLTITRTDAGYTVRIDAILKSYVIDGKPVQKREVEHFTFISDKGDLRIARK